MVYMNYFFSWLTELWHVISNNMHSLIRAVASRLNILWLVSYWLNTIKFWSFKGGGGGGGGGAVQRHYNRLILHLSKCHIVGNHMSRLNFKFCWKESLPWITFFTMKGHCRHPSLIIPRESKPWCKTFRFTSLTSSFWWSWFPNSLSAVLWFSCIIHYWNRSFWTTPRMSLKSHLIVYNYNWPMQRLCPTSSISHK